MRRIKETLKCVLRFFMDLLIQILILFKKMSDAIFTRGHHFKIVEPLVESNLGWNSLASRVVDYWNFLPSDIFKVSNLEGFSAKLNCIKFSNFG